MVLKTYFDAIGRLSGPVYVLASLVSLGLVLYLSFTGATHVDTISEDVNSKELFHFVAYATIATAGFTILDFAIMCCETKSKRIAIRVTPLQIFTGTLATFVGFALWVLDNDKKALTMQLVFFQHAANAVQLAAIFNQPRNYLDNPSNS